MSGELFLLLLFGGAVGVLGLLASVLSSGDGDDFGGMGALDDDATGAGWASRGGLDDDAHARSLFDDSPTGSHSFGSGFDDHSFDDCSAVNPATGLPMLGGTGGLDIDGNPFGADLSDFGGGFGGNHFDDFGSGSAFDDFGAGGSDIGGGSFSDW